MAPSPRSESCCDQRRLRLVLCSAAAGAAALLVPDCLLGRRCSSPRPPPLPASAFAAAAVRAAALAAPPAAAAPALEANSTARQPPRSSRAAPPPPRPAAELAGVPSESEGALPAELRAALARHRAQCAEQRGAHADPVRVNGLEIDRSVPLSDAPSAELLGLGPTAAGAALLLLLLSRAAGGRPVCAGGDGWEVAAEGPEERMAGRVRDIGGGAYLVALLPRVPQRLRVCMRLYWGARLRGAPAWAPSNLTAALTGGFGSAVGKRPELRLSDWCAAAGAADSSPVCREVAVTGDGPSLPPAPCEARWDGALPGSWVRSPSGDCSPGLCLGDLRWLSTGGWVFVPRSCYLRLYARDPAWRCLRGRRLLWFGDSTQKQPATNLLEMILGVPVLDRDRSFRWHVPNCDGASLRKIGYKQWRRRGCADPFDLRRWGSPEWAERRNPQRPAEGLRTRFVWGGGRDVKQPPWGPLNALSLLPAGADGGADTGARGELLQGLAELRPGDAVLLQSWAWDPHRGDWAAYAPKLRWLLDTVLAAVPPAVHVHWDTAHPFCVDDRANTPEKGCESQVTNKFSSVAAGLIGDMVVDEVIPEYQRRYPGRLTALHRWPMALPYASGHEYCHFGLHFGSTPQFCHIFSFDEPRRCYRNWLVDKFEIQVWLNAVCPPQDAADLGGAHAGSVEDGVTAPQPRR